MPSSLERGLSNQLVVIGDRMESVSRAVELAGNVDPRVQKIVSEQLGPVVTSAWKGALLFGSNELDNTQNLRPKENAQIVTLEKAWREYIAHVYLQQRSDNDEVRQGRVVGDLNLIGLLGLGFRTIYGATEYTHTLTRLIHGKSVRDAERYTQALIDYLTGVKSSLQKEKPTSSQSGIMKFVNKLIYDGGPRPINVMYEIAQATGQVGRQNEFLRAIVSKMAVSAFTVIQARKELQRAEKHVQAETNRELTMPSQAIQGIAPELRRVEGRLKAMENTRADLVTRLNSLMGSTGMTEEQVNVSKELARVDMEVMRLQIIHGQLRAQMDQEIALLLAADGRVDFLSSGLNSIRDNIHGLIESALFTNQLFIRTNSDIYAALVLVARAKSRAEIAKILHEYQEKIKQLPGEIISAINNGVEEGRISSGGTVQIQTKTHPSLPTP